ncbi:MAM and LDL-receptor class A domain-containing protein 1 isoform X2 [Nematostella vectensis]|uniref:MAM and LDL-receptor class A domain-containing protein 1 isoform X2 n=1 Tax=Nematostella vectensis TaxID=45351 RepID=UPI0020770A5C|nr:MAM and LDL-receptor class A domain-containing protein 1 isoform X2 [Nematostella vectensis]
MTAIAVFGIIIAVVSAENPASTYYRGGCGGTITGASGTFSSPNFPSNYPDNAMCEWTITAPVGTSRIDIAFPAFDVEWGPSCDWDYLTVKDKAGNQVGDKICGRPYALKLSVPGDIAVVGFVSDGSGNEKGFQLQYAAMAPPKPKSMGDCDFDEGLCKDWENLDNKFDQFDWSPGRGSTPTALTGPTADHSGKGQYAYIEATGQRQGSTARLATPLIPGPRCLKFFFYQYGIAGMGRLRVYVVTNGNQRLAMSLEGSQGNQWKAATIQIDETVPYKVVFEGTVGQSDYSDIAIDDVTFSKDKCPSTGSECGGILTSKSGTFSYPQSSSVYPNNARCMWTIRPSTQTSLVVIKFNSFDVEQEYRCRDDYVVVSDSKGNPVVQPRFCGVYPEGFGLKVQGNEAQIYFHSNEHLGRKGFNVSYAVLAESSADDCDFDAGLCSMWFNSKSDDFDWSIGGGHTRSFFTGPRRGDVYALGKYAFIEASHRRPNDRAVLVSGVMTGERCLLFSYNMRGRMMGTLEVLVTSGQGTRKVWQAAGDHGYKWYQGNVSIKETGTYQVMFVGIVGYGFTSDIALDEIAFKNGACAPDPGCDRVLTGATGEITSPNYPSPYPPGVDCTWTVIPPPQYDNVAITIHDMDIENTPQCSKDYLVIEDITGTRVEHKLCGDEGKVNKTIALSWHQGMLQFRSDADGNGRGFRATYKALGSTPTCGGQLSGYTGDIKTPHYPASYPPREWCLVWTSARLEN